MPLRYFDFALKEAIRCIRQVNKCGSVAYISGSNTCNYLMVNLEINRAGRQIIGHARPTAGNITSTLSSTEEGNQLPFHSATFPKEHECRCYTDLELRRNNGLDAEEPGVHDTPRYPEGKSLSNRSQAKIQ